MDKADTTQLYNNLILCISICESCKKNIDKSSHYVNETGLTPRSAQLPNALYNASTNLKNAAYHLNLAIQALP